MTKEKYLENALLLSHFVRPQTSSEMAPDLTRPVNGTGFQLTFPWSIAVAKIGPTQECFTSSSSTYQVQPWNSQCGYICTYVYICHTFITSLLRNFLAVMYAFNYSRPLDTNNCYCKENSTKNNFSFFTKLNL
jgi:hypothetical protein